MILDFLFFFQHCTELTEKELSGVCVLRTD